MKIHYFRREHPNFGDELNWWMWPRLIENFFDEDPSAMFLGIGSVIGEPMPEAGKKIVFGAGYVPQYNDPPDLNDGSWEIYFVRGPRTCKILNLSPDKSVGDSAILLRTLIDNKSELAETVPFIPHFESLDRGRWHEACRLAGITLIDPRNPLDEVISQLLRSKLVIAEAMHGAIVADAFRRPWIPLLPIDSNHREKWFDWAEALDLDLEPYRLWPSTFAELDTAMIRKPGILRLSNFLAKSPLSTATESGLAHIAAERLKWLATRNPQMSSDAKIDSVTSQMQEKLRQLKQDHGK